MDAIPIKPEEKSSASTALSRLEEENDALLQERDKLREWLSKYRKEFIQAEERADKAEAEVSHLKRALRKAEDENDALKLRLKESELKFSTKTPTNIQTPVEKGRSPSIEFVESRVIAINDSAACNSDVSKPLAPLKDLKRATSTIANGLRKASTPRLIPYVSVPPRDYPLKRRSLSIHVDGESRALKRQRVKANNTAIPTDITSQSSSLASGSSVTTGTASTSGVADSTTAHAPKTPPASPALITKLKHSPTTPKIASKTKAPPASPTVLSKIKLPSSPEDTSALLKSPTSRITLTGPKPPTSSQNKPTLTTNVVPSKPSSSATSQVKLKSKREATAFPSLQTAHLANTTPLSIDPSPPELCVPRAFLRLAYGGSDQQLLQYFPASASPSSVSIWTASSSSTTKRKGTSSMSTKAPQRRFVFPKMNMNPLMPSHPGEPGLLFASRHEVLERPAWGLWCRDSDPGKSVVWRYLGEYESTLVGEMSGEDFKKQSDMVRSQWGKLILGSKKIDVYVAMRARIALRLAGLIPASSKQAADNLEAKEMSAIKARKGRPVTESDIVDALERGDERIDILRMECVHYDHVLAQDMQEKFKRYPEMVKEYKLKKGMTVSSARVKKTAVKSGSNSAWGKGITRQMDVDGDENGDQVHEPESEEDLTRTSNRLMRKSRRIHPRVGVEDAGNSILDLTISEIDMHETSDASFQSDLTDYDYYDDEASPLASL